MYCFVVCTLAASLIMSVPDSLVQINYSRRLSIHSTPPTSKQSPAISDHGIRSIILDVKLGENLEAFNKIKPTFKQCLMSSLLSSVQKDSVLKEVEKSRLNVHRVFAMSLGGTTTGIRTTFHVLKTDAKAILKLVDTPVFHYMNDQCLEIQTNTRSVDYTPATLADDDEKQEAIAELHNPPSELSKTAFALCIALGLMAAIVFWYDNFCQPEMEYQRVAQDKKNSSLAEESSLPDDEEGLLVEMNELKNSESSPSECAQTPGIV